MSARKREVPEPAPPTPGNARNIGCRVDGATLARLDALVPFLSTPYMTANRSDVMRALMVEALPILERRAARRRRTS